MVKMMNCLICLLCSAQSSKPLCVLPGTVLAESKWSKSVSQSLVPCQHSLSTDSTCGAATLQLLGAEGNLWHMIHQKYSHTNYYFVICHLDLLRCWPIVKQLMYLSSLSKFILTRPWAPPTKTHYFFAPSKAAAQPTRL